jgi:benzil reductase ((S)-benzoin forming)
MIYIITGVSRGLGKAIAQRFLDKGDKVYGIGRSHSIEHPNFSFLECDLSDNFALTSIELPVFNEPVTLINNAGIIGEIKRLGDQDTPDLENVLQVNTIAPQILTNIVYHQVENKSDFTLVNISSGAGRRAIPSWAAYCASKAALNMLSEGFHLEEKEKGNDIKVYSVSPGVIDTNMQDQIRSADPKDFSAIDNFIALKNEDNLYSPEEGAIRLEKLLELPYSGEVLCDLREI